MSSKNIVFLVVALIAVLGIGGVVGYVYTTRYSKSVVVTDTKADPTPIVRTGTSATVSPTSAVATTTKSTASQLSKELQDTVDDGGAKDLESLKKDAAGL